MCWACSKECFLQDFSQDWNEIGDEDQIAKFSLYRLRLTWGELLNKCSQYSIFKGRIKTWSSRACIEADFSWCQRFNQVDFTIIFFLYQRYNSSEYLGENIARPLIESSVEDRWTMYIAPSVLRERQIEREWEREREGRRKREREEETEKEEEREKRKRKRMRKRERERDRTKLMEKKERKKFVMQTKKLMFPKNSGSVPFVKFLNIFFTLQLISSPGKEE